MATYEENLAQMSQPYDYAPLPIRGGGQGRAFTGLLGNIFGGGGGATGLEDYLTPAQTEQMNRQALLQAAIAASQASGPSTTPRSFMQILGAGLAGGQQGYQQAQQGAIQQSLLAERLGEKKASKQMQSQVQQFLTQPAPAGVDPNQFKAAQYMKLADVYAASNPEQSQKFFDMAQKLTPRIEVTGQPFEVTGAKGDPIMVQQFKDGTIKTLEGFGPKRDVILQNLNGKVVAVDKSTLRGGEEMLMTLSPAEEQRLKMDAERLGLDKERLKIELQNLKIAQQRLGLSQAEFQRNGYERMENEDGVFYVSKVPGLPAIPVSGPTGAPLKGKAPPKPTEGETNAAGFAQQMENATSIINTLPAGAQPGMGSGVAGSIPFIGEAVKRGVQPAATQQYEQAAQAWIRAKLRKESGAAIGVDEMNQEYRTYFPQIGDTSDVITQKANARAIATEAMKRSAGKSYTPPPETPKPAGGIAEGTESMSKSGKPIIYRNGNWEYK
jgi:hypothetical protein